MKYSIEKMKPEDWPQVRSIYLEGIAAGHSTFETDAPDWSTWDAGHLRVARLVSVGEEALFGWAALSPTSSRRVYSGVAECSLYVTPGRRRHGIGSALLAELITLSEQSGIWTLQGSIFPENTASLALFGLHGFRVVGLRERVGRMEYGEFAGRWRDVVVVERRSAQAGME